MRLIHILCSLSLFLLFACGEEKEFMTPKSNKIVLDVNADEYSLNGNVLGKTIVDISNNDNLLIKALDKELKRIRQNENKEAKEKNLSSKGFLVKVHFDDNLSFDEFHKALATFGFSGFTSIQYVIGSNFKDIYDLHLRQRSSGSDECDQLNSTKRALDLLLGKISKNQVLEQQIKIKECQIERAMNYIDLSLSFENQDGNWDYIVGLNETGLTDGKKLYSFNTENELWKFIEDIRLRRGLQDKKDKDEIMFALRKNVSLKDLAPIIKKLTSYGYKISFALVSG